jgi:hypothetical protein
VLIGLLAANLGDTYKIIFLSSLGSILIVGLTFYLYLRNQAHKMLLRLREVEYSYLTGLTVQNFMEGFLGIIELDLGSQTAGTAIYLIRIYFTIVEGGITYKIVEAHKKCISERQSRRRTRS